MLPLRAWRRRRWRLAALGAFLMVWTLVSVAVIPEGASHFVLRTTAVWLPGLTIALLLLLRSGRVPPGALATGDTLYREFFENANDAFYVASADGSILMANPAARRLLGYPEGAPLEGANLFHVIAPEFFPRVEEMIRRKELEGGRTLYRLKIVDRSGGRIPVEANTTLLYGPDGRPCGVHGVVRDLREREAAERALRESRALFRSILRQLPVGVVLASAEGDVVHANPAARELFRAFSDDGETAAAEGLRVPAVFWRQVQEERTDVRAGGDPPRVVEIGSCPVELEGGRTGYLLLLRDVTEERSLARTVNQQSRLAMAGQLAAGVAHDFNNLLQGISLTAELMLAGEHSPQLGPDLASIVEQARRGSRLVRQLLDFARRSPQTQGAVDMATLLRSVTRLLARALPDHIVFSLIIEDEPLPVLGDETQLEEVLTNLVLNARDAMPEGGTLTVRASMTTVAPQDREGSMSGDRVLVTVSDTGCGIPEEVGQRVFEPFFTTKERTAGTGLGLAQASGIATAHGGHLTFESVPGRGTTFILTLPRFEGAPSAASEAARPVVRGHGELVLVVEDDADVRMAVARHLRRSGYRVIHAAEGGEALRSIEGVEERVRVVLMDTVLPGIPASELRETLGSRCPAARFVAMRSHAGRAAAASLERRFERWLDKPFLFSELAEVLDGILRAGTPNGRHGTPGDVP